MITIRRRVAIVSVLSLGSLQLAGCAERPLRPPDDRYCFRAKTRSGSKPTCTPGPVPDLAADEKAKRFEPVPGSLVVYVVRRRWGDAAYVVNVTMDGGELVGTTPASFVRLVVPPGLHKLSFEWKKGRGVLDVRGDAGQVVFVGIRIWLCLRRQSRPDCSSSISVFMSGPKFFGCSYCRCGSSARHLVFIGIANDLARRPGGRS